MRNRLIPIILLLALLLSACGGAEPEPERAERSRSFFAMDTIMSVRAAECTEAELDALTDYAAALEAQVSVTADTSEVFALNAAGTGALTGDALTLLRRGLELCEATGGALDLTVYPVVRAWGFTTGDYRVPERGELDALLERVDYRAVSLGDDGTVTLPAGAMLDLGSVTKGYLGDRLCGMLRDAGVESALLDLGGNVQALGGKPDGSDWRVGVRDPKGEGLLGALSIRDRAVVTSGGYERYFVDDSGTLRWHIMDPATGYPADSGLISVTVVGPEGLVCDALSTALFVLGAEKAAALWRARGDFELLLVTDGGELLLTPGLAERFTPDPAADYTLSLIT